MITTWTAPEYMTALRDNLRLRAGMAGVQIHSAPIANDELEMKALAMVDVYSDDESAALGDSRRKEEYVIEGVIQVMEPGSGEEAAVACRDEAMRIFAEVEAEVNANPTQGLNPSSQRIRMSEITRKVLRQAYQDNYRRCAIEFDLTVTARISPKNL